jgi:RHS repeat-associated protein
MHYNAEGHRIGVNISGTEYDDIINPQAALSQVLVRTTADNITYYVYGLGLIGEQSQNGYGVYHPDFRGSTVILTDAGGSVTDRYMYDAYGNLMNHSGSSDTPFLYNGQYGIMTDGNGLIYMRARYYNPEVRRFVSQDSEEGDIGNPLSLNLFSYVENNPVNYVDPSGNVPMYSLYYKTYQNESYDSLLSTYTSLQNRIKNETIILQGGSSFTDTLRAQLNLEDATGRYQIVNELLIIKGYNYSQEDKERANQTILDLEQQESDQMNEIAMGVVGGGGGLRMTAKEATLAAEKLGFKITNYYSHGQPVFKKGNQYITPDVDAHSGGIWKMADSIENLLKKKTRMGTYDENLRRIGD